MKLAGVLWTFLGIVLALVLYIFALAVLSGATLSIMWDWFIVPLGVTGINLWWGIGIMALIGFIRYDSSDPETKEIKKAKTGGAVVGLMVNALWSKVVVCLFTLLVGFVFHGLM